MDEFTPAPKRQPGQSTESWLKALIAHHNAKADFWDKQDSSFLCRVHLKAAKNFQKRLEKRTKP